MSGYRTTREMVQHLQCKKGLEKMIQHLPSTSEGQQYPWGLGSTLLSWLLTDALRNSIHSVTEHTLSVQFSVHLNEPTVSAARLKAKGSIYPRVNVEHNSKIYQQFFSPFPISFTFSSGIYIPILSIP